uniref:Alpha-tubulin N-acetyltransferase n=1 Tax=Parastrongyloides trichosuri TaxID=131310 RepID=A0A0N5A6M9_PARTI
MEINYDLGEIFTDEIAILTKDTLKKYNPKQYWGIEKAINEMGKLSMTAQGLRKVLTSYQKIVDSNEEQTLYVMWKKNPNNEKHSIVVGILKVGRKKLYLTDDRLQKYEDIPLCVLDFYVHNTLQRKGNGHKIFEEMLRHEKLDAIQLAIDKPSDSLLEFMKKYYGLDKPIWQTTNFVVFNGFFDRLKDNNNIGRNNNVKKIGMSEKIPIEEPGVHPSRFGKKQRFGQCQAAQIIHGGGETPRKVEMDPNTAIGRKNLRDFGHTQIW